MSWAGLNNRLSEDAAVLKYDEHSPPCGLGRIRAEARLDVRLESLAHHEIESRGVRLLEAPRRGVGDKIVALYFLDITRSTFSNRKNHLILLFMELDVDNSICPGSKATDHIGDGIELAVTFVQTTGVKSTARRVARIS